MPSASFTATLLLFAFLFNLRQETLTAGEITQLRRGFYADFCPEAERIVRDTMRRAMARESRSGASIMRLQFHDCFVNGCDGSLLLDDTPAMIGEKLALSNINSLRSFEVIDEVKEALEEACPQIVSCADIIIMAARDAVALVYSIMWKIEKLGAYDKSNDMLEKSKRGYFIWQIFNCNIIKF